MANLFCVQSLVLKRVVPVRCHWSRRTRRQLWFPYAAERITMPSAIPVVDPHVGKQLDIGQAIQPRSEVLLASWLQRERFAFIDMRMAGQWPRPIDAGLWMTCGKSAVAAARHPIDVGLSAEPWDSPKPTRSDARKRPLTSATSGFRTAAQLCSDFAGHEAKRDQQDAQSYCVMHRGNR